MAVNSTVFDWEVFKSLKLHVVQPVQIATTNCYDGYCALLLTQSGKVFAIGKSSYGCLGLGEVTETAEPVELKELSGVAGVCVCGSYGDALAYTSEGKVYVWGNNVSWNRPQLVPELTDVVDARCRAGHYLALTKSGKLYEWRGVDTWYNKLNALSTTPKVVTLNEVITSIACGPFHSLALTKDGQVYSWGNKYNSGEYVDQPMTQILLPETVAKIACGVEHSLVLTHSGKLYTWGYNYCGLGDPSGSTETQTPVQVGQNIGRFVDIAVNGFRTNAAVSNTGAVYMWGYGENGAIVKTPTKTAYLEMHQVFANIRSSNYSWTPKTPSSNTVKDSSSVAGKLKASCNDEHDCNEAAIIEPEGQVQLNCNTLEQSQTDMNCNHAEAKIHHLEEYVEKLKKEFAKLIDELKEGRAKLKEENIILKEDNAKFQNELKEELKEDNARFKDELKEENIKLKEILANFKFKDELKEEINKLKEDTTNFKDELKAEIVKLKNELKEDNANLKKDIAKLKDEPKGDDGKLRDEFKYPTTVVSPREQEEKGKHNEAAITQPEERRLQLPVYLAQLEHGPINVDSSNNIEEDNVNLRKELAKLQDGFKNLKALLFPQERERSSCEDNKDREIQRGRRGRITPTTASVTYKDSNQNKQEDCNEAAIIEPEGQVKVNCNTLEQSQTNMNCNHAEAKIHHLEEYVENLKKEFAKLIDELKEGSAKLKEENIILKEDNAKFQNELKEELKEDNARFKDELKEENIMLKEEINKLKEDTTNFKDELKAEIVKLKNELKEDNANLKKDIAKLKDEPKGDDGKLRDEFKYPTTVVSPREQEEKGKHNEAAITQPKERGLQLPVYLAQLEHGPINVDSSNNIEEDNVNLRKELAKLQDGFKNLKALLFPQERERSSCEDNKDREIQRGRRGRITPTTASVTYKDSNQNKQ